MKLVSPGNLTVGDGGAGFRALSFAGQFRQGKSGAAQLQAGGRRTGFRLRCGVGDDLLQEGLGRKAALPRRLLKSGRHFLLHPGLQQHCHTPSVISALNLSTTGNQP